MFRIVILLEPIDSRRLGTYSAYKATALFPVSPRCKTLFSWYQLRWGLELHSTLKFLTKYSPEKIIFYWGISLLGVFSFPWHTNQIVLSSVKMALSKSLLLSAQRCTNARQARWFAFRTIWQYWSPHFVYPSFFLAHLIVAVDISEHQGCYTWVSGVLRL